MKLLKVALESSWIYDDEKSCCVTGRNVIVWLQLEYGSRCGCCCRVGKNDYECGKGRAEYS